MRFFSLSVVARIAQPFVGVLVYVKHLFAQTCVTTMDRIENVIFSGLDRIITRCITNRVSQPNCHSIVVFTYVTGVLTWLFILNSIIDSFPMLGISLAWCNAYVVYFRIDRVFDRIRGHVLRRYLVVPVGRRFP